MKEFKEVSFRIEDIEFSRIGSGKIFDVMHKKYGLGSVFYHVSIIPMSKDTLKLDLEDETSHILISWVNLHRGHLNQLIRGFEDVGIPYKILGDV